MLAHVMLLVQSSVVVLLLLKWMSAATVSVVDTTEEDRASQARLCIADHEGASLPARRSSLAVRGSLALRPVLD